MLSGVIAVTNFALKGRLSFGKALFIDFLELAYSIKMG